MSKTLLGGVVLLGCFVKLGLGILPLEGFVVGLSHAFFLMLFFVFPYGLWNNSFFLLDHAFV
jgi:hypothetical protein